MIHGIERDTPYVGIPLDKERAVVLFAPTEKRDYSFHLQIHNSNPKVIADFERMRDLAVKINEHGNMQTTLTVSIEAMEAIVMAYCELVDWKRSTGETTP